MIMDKIELVHGIYLKLPLPNSKLSTNRSHGQHWGVTSNLKKKDKDIGFWTTKEYLNSLSDNKKKLYISKSHVLEIEMIVHKKGKRRLDIDNFIRAFKSMQDGIFLALGLDDKAILKLTFNYLLNAPEDMVFYGLSIDDSPRFIELRKHKKK